MVEAILNLKKCTRGIFGASSEFVWRDVYVSFLKKISFLQFYSRFNPNALALFSFAEQCGGFSGGKGVTVK